jgi:hypothetical protein
MTLCLTGSRFLSSFLFSVAFMAAGIGMGMAAEEVPSLDNAPAQAATITAAEVSGQTTTLQIQPAISAHKNASGQSSSILVALPKSATSFRIDAQGASVTAPDGIMYMRGRPVIRAIIEDSNATGIAMTVSHNGDWNAERESSGRLFSPALDAALGKTIPEFFMENTTVSHGTYLIIYPPAFQTAIQPLVDWKTRKGLRVETVSTSVTGSTTDGIKAWIQNAYDTAPFPPEYVLLAGDVSDIPTYSFHGNPSDLPYVELEGNDWMPDAMIGRLPVETLTQAQTLINKIVMYESTPYMDDTAWYTKAVGVAGQMGSDTPLHTVRYCLDQLESIGFAAADTSNILPPPGEYGRFIVSDTQPVGPGLPPWGISTQLGPDHIKTAMDDGSSFVIYRGWAQGTAGWEKPYFLVEHISSLDNGAFLPVVMSFVCLTGDYTIGNACMGEAFIREGSPEDPTGGAVAFIGNGEHWSHTRYNDAMAISFFERIVDDNIVDLGTLMTAGKIRFMDFFPHEMSADEFGEESVEFYFHIYNLLGDPELNFWKQAPVLLSANAPAGLTPGQNSLSLQILEIDGVTAVNHARVGVVQDGQLLGSGFTDAQGHALISLSGISDGSAVSVTVTGSGLHPLSFDIGTSTALSFLGLTSMDMDDSTGNNDDVANPNEILLLAADFLNSGSENSADSSVQMSILSGNATVITGVSTLGIVASGNSASVATPLSIQVGENASDGDIISVEFDVTNGQNHDLSLWTFEVHTPALTVLAMTQPDGSQLVSGQTSDVVLTLRNDGSTATSGGEITLELVTSDGNSLISNGTTFGAIAPGATIVSDAGISLEIAPTTATGTNLSFNMETVFTETSVAQSTCSLVVGPVDAGSPVGPDSYGYYAYDSADYDYPANRPTYQWLEISTAFGGPGTAVVLNQPDNYALDLVVDLPFGTFQYYGQEYSQIRISDNGWIAFDTQPFFNFYNWAIPTTHGNGALVAPFWDNLNPYINANDPQPGSNGILRDGIYTWYDVDNGRFIVEWSRLPHYKPEILGMQTFQLVLMDPAVHNTPTGDGEIQFIYRNIINNDHLRNFATVGIESPDGTDGLQLSFSAINANGMAPLQSGLAVKITTEAPVRVPYEVEAMTARAVAGVTTLTWDVDDPRPVVGWHIDRVVGTQTTRLTAEPLAGDARTFVDQQINSAGSDDAVSYVLTALHPYGVTSQPGKTAAQAVNTFQLALYAPQPNPARGESTIGFALPGDSVASLKVYDIAGRCVRTLLDGAVTAGQEFILWDGRNNSGLPVAGGIYFYRLETGGQTLTRKLTFVR